MPFKNPQTGYYYTQLRLPGYGRLPRTSLRTKRKRDAALLEEAIRELDRRATFENADFCRILDALTGNGHGRPGTVSPQQILIATREEGGDQRLLTSLDDPQLLRVMEEYFAAAGTGRVRITKADRHSRTTIEKHAPEVLGEKPRFSQITESGAVQSLLERIEKEEDKKRASVCRYEKRLLSKILAWRLGRVERDLIFADVQFSAGDDTRRIRLHAVSDKALQRLYDELKAGYWKTGDELAPIYAEIAVLTGAEIRPLSETRNADVIELHHEGQAWGHVYLRGTKKIKTEQGHRDRPLLIVPHLWKLVRSYWRPDEPDERIFPLKYSRFYTIWKKAVVRAGLDRAAHNDTPLRPHDLRSIFSSRAERAKIERTKIGFGGLGHKDLAQTDRYMTNEVSLTFEDMLRMTGE